MIKLLLYFCSVFLLSVPTLTLLHSCDGEKQHDAIDDIDIKGVSHKNGLTEPTTNCNTCHGKSLTGGKTVGAPSCYSCHDDLWENISDEEIALIGSN